jgi:hypothetical protein
MPTLPTRHHRASIVEIPPRVNAHLGFDSESSDPQTMNYKRGKLMIMTLRKDDAG